MRLRYYWPDFLHAVHFLTRVPVPSYAYSERALSSSVKFFPLVGLLVGAASAALYLALDPHLPRLVTAALVLLFMVCITGCLHEDGLADTADAFGGGWHREQVLTILRDSRIGSYGASALALSLGLRLVLLASLPRVAVLPVLTSAHILCRWTALPLSYHLRPARVAQVGKSEGQGARIAQLTTAATLIGGTVFSFACIALTLRWRASYAILASLLTTTLSGWYYQKRIGGITGDCFGATNQMTEVAVYLCGVWIA